jgi:uncharacterized membrane protein YqhA
MSDQIPQNQDKRNFTGERLVESFLWNSRFVVLVAVIASLFTSFAIFYMTVIDVYFTIAHLSNYYALGDAERASLKAMTVAHVVGSVDGFLLGAIMLIFSLGLYELFISKIDPADGKSSSKILIINSLDDLKDKLAKVILMILIVMFFEQAIFLKPEAPLELLYYALAIMLVAAALYLSHKAYEKH